MQRFLRAVVAALALAAAVAHAEPIRIVAAQSVYGDICRQIGGDGVSVVSVLGSVNQDPHAFEAGASVARAVAQARLVVVNGAGYDSWMTRLLAASRARSRDVIDVARLAGRRDGDNPHLWYDPRAVSAFARAFAEALARIDPPRSDDYARRHAAFAASMRPLFDRIGEMRARHAGAAVTATEPVLDYMAAELGLKVRNGRFQLAVMNGTEPAARDIAAFERDLRGGAVRALISTRQTTSRLAERMREVAAASDVPVVEVTETAPAGVTYAQWMLAQLDALDRALSRR